MALISLLTDFGDRDTYVGTMKAVILDIAPEANLVDLCHHVPPQDIEEGAWLLGNSYAFFPKGTIHLAVVDPGVGTARRAIALKAGDHTFVGPDNGLFSLVLERETNYQAVQLTNTQYHRERLSRTFHGRDVFAPVAAHLASGVPLQALGTAISDLVRLPSTEPEELSDGLRVRILRVDSFGNLVTNLTEERFAEWIARHPGKSVVVDIGRRQIEGVRNAYSEVPAGGLLSIFGSSGRLEIAVSGGSAKEELKIGKEAQVFVSAVDEYTLRRGV